MTLVTVIDPKNIQIVEAAAHSLVGATAPDGIISKISAKVKTYLEAEVASPRATGIGIDVRVVTGSPAETVVAEANTVGDDLISMSNQRESASAGGILGNATDRVLKSTSIPLLILQPENMSDESVGSGLVQHIVVPLDGSMLSEEAIASATALA
jgi:nucleotide-binding universal stress UspA family protein